MDLSIYVPAGAHFNNQDDKDIALKLTEDAVIADAVAPKIVQFAFELGAMAISSSHDPDRRLK